MHHLTEISRNQKLGPMPASTHSITTCPDTCPLKSGGGCYAEYGPLAIHWKKISRGERGGSFKDFLAQVRRLPKVMWRYAQAGDLPGKGDKINRKKLIALAKANRRRPVIAFTHKPLNPDNLAAIKEAESMGFHVNGSADNPADADNILEAGLSAATILPSEYQRGKNETLTHYRKRLRKLPNTTPKGVKIAVCPATFTDATCITCGICASRRPNNTVIGFPAHGTGVRKADTLARRGEIDQESTS